MSDMAKRVQRLERILTISRELSSTMTLKPLLSRIVEVAADLTDSEGASILLEDNRTGELRFRAVSGEPAEQLTGIPVPVDESIAGMVMKDGEPLIISDAQNDPRHYGDVGQQLNQEIRSLVAVPMRIKERRIGVLEAINKSKQRTFTEQDVETLTILGAQAAVAIENARLVEALREANRRLGELDEMKSDFIAIASHELRTPLSLILGYAILLQEQLEEKEVGPHLDVVLKSALRLKRIIETMLNLRYLETGDLELSRQAFNLLEEIEQACKAYRPLAKAKNLTLETHLIEEPMPVYADRSKIRLVMDNLLSNAVKFTPSGGKVRVTAARRGQVAKISVIDNGVGIPKRALERIFEPFEQVEHHMTRRHGGMGLGLSIVKGLIELHGGNVWAESVLGYGSCFIFVLPMETSLSPS